MNRKKNSRIKTAAAVSVLVVLLAGITGCNGKNSKNYQNTAIAMGTVITQNMYGGNEETAEDILGVINELEGTISWRIETSDVAKINEAAGKGTTVTVSTELAGWLKYCREVYEESDGRLDITVGPVARLWDIGGDNPRIPEEEELKDAMEKIGSDRLLVKDNEAELALEGGQLDLGAVGKGLACDMIFDYLEEENQDISGTFSVGGSVLIYGAKPNGQDWRIGIRDPRGEENEYMAALNFEQTEEEWVCVSTSGDYEKYFEKDGVRYHHILDPKTGAPADSGLISVTVISKSGFLSDVLSTACFISGQEEGLKLAESFGAEAIVINRDKEVWMTEGAEEYFELLSKEYTLSNEEK